MESLKFILSLLIDTVRDQARQARRTATVGSISAEQIIITVALVGLAIAVVAGIVGFATGKIGQLPS
ncbi:hypothetical protein ACT3TZ_13730 [Brachybacterium sp. AOP25-B2-12]|uniref:hypothetical protein n=1 Tax=Brachybacterium sp. AOP25-B2-12 TaxID=3457710 RepID=UPI0040336EC0